MILGESLIQAGLVEADDIDLALDRQRKLGGALGQNLVALGLITPEELDHVFNMQPPPVRALEDTGLDVNYLMTLALKIVHTYDSDTVVKIADELMLPAPVVSELADLADERGFLENLGTNTAGSSGEHHFALTNKGRQWVAEAYAISQYVGPAPVPLSSYQLQVGRQRITNDRVDVDSLEECLSHLVLPEDLIERLGPAVNSGRALLLYGPSGNGKTSVTFGLSQVFRQCIYIPHAIEVDGQIIKVFDPMLHIVSTPNRSNGNGSNGVNGVNGTNGTKGSKRANGANGSNGSKTSLLRDDTDRRWVRCRRPMVITGGELTLDMLDLAYNSHSKYHEAPIQMKACGGLIVIDDFGRQRVAPQKVLNRWIVPLENRFDFLTTHTGKKFKVPFDGLVIFSTNLSPKDLMDSAMLRRIPYNFLLDSPTVEEYGQIFEIACRGIGVDYDPEIVVSLMADFYGVVGLPLARYHPKFILDHVVDFCRYKGLPPVLSPDTVLAAAQHLCTRSWNEPGI